MRCAVLASVVAIAFAAGAPCCAQSLTVVTLGDSLTAGDGDDGVGGGYPARLLTMLQSDHPGSTLQNLAVSGQTSDDLVNTQLTPAVAALNQAPVGNRRLGLVWIGSNDLFGLYNYVCDYEYGNDYDACESATFGYYRANIDTILSDLAATGAELYIALLDDQSRRPIMTDAALRISYFDQISDQDVARMSTQVRDYNAEIAAQAAAHGATTVDFFGTTIFEDWATLDSDGNHPNGAGYDAIAAIWYAAVTGQPSATHRLAVTRAGTGTGDVTSTPAGIACGTTCDHDYAAGTAVVLTATPAAGSVFAGWSGACTGAGTCSVTMSADRAVRATFDEAAASSYSWVVPVVAHGPGDAGTNWRSSVVCLNDSGVDADVSLVLASTTGTWRATATVAAGATVEWADVVVSLFGRPAGAATSGALHLSSDQRLWITSRTFNQGDGGTFGQYLPAIEADDAFSGPGRGLLLNLKGIGFRSNVGVVNLGTTPCEVLITLYAEDGTLIGTAHSVTVPGGRWVQKNDVFSWLGAAARPLAYATVELAVAGDQIWAYASVVDDTTGDATTVPLLWE